MECDARRGPRGRARAHGRSLREASRRADRAAAIRGREDARRCARRSARGGRLLPLLREPSAHIARARTHARPDRRDQRAASSRARRLRLHQPVEFSARDFHRAGGGGAGRGQFRDCEARRADAAGRRRRDPPDARGGHSAVRAASRARRRRGGGRTRRGCARRRRGVHRVDRGRAADQPRARREKTDPSCR